MSIPEPEVFQVESGESFTFMRIEVSLTPDGKLQANGSAGRTHITFKGYSGGGCGSSLRCLAILVKPGIVHAFSGMTHGPQMIDIDAILAAYDIQ